MAIEHWVIERPLPGQAACGDMGIVKELPGEVFMGIADVLGHGEKAAMLAESIRDYFERNSQRGVVELVEGLHERIRGSRGAVCAVCRLEVATGLLRYAGIGDVSLSIFGRQKARLSFPPGIVGYAMRTPKEGSFKLEGGDVVLLHTDGIRTHVELEEALLGGSPRAIAERVIERFSRREDDACCIVLKYAR